MRNLMALASEGAGRDGRASRGAANSPKSVASGARMHELLVACLRQIASASRRLTPAHGLGAALVLFGLSGGAVTRPTFAGDKIASTAADAWPSSVEARYRLRYNGIDVGHLHVSSSAEGGAYTLSGSGKVSAFFGAVTWGGSSKVTGELRGDEPAPSTYAFDWRHNKKRGDIRMSFNDRVATDISVTPPPGPHADHVPLKESDKRGVLDPVSAVLMLTRIDGRHPCDRRVGIFDGKQRYDIVLTPKRTTTLPAAAGEGRSETAYVCRAMYEPVAGHRDNEATKTYASNRDVEVILRKVAGSGLLIPYSVTVPTFWGTGSMVTDRIEVVTRGAGRIALTR